MKNKKVLYCLLGLALVIFFLMKVISKDVDSSKSGVEKKLIFQPRATVENARKMLDDQLRKDYGEEFKIGGLYKRTAAGESFYQTRIVPKSKIGTEEEKEHTVEAYVDIKRGRLVRSGDSYRLVGLTQDTERYFQKLLEEHFGKFVRAKTNVEYHLIDLNNKPRVYVTLGTTFEKSVETLRLNKEPKLMLTQFIYIFTKKLSKREEDVYREKIWSYVEMLKEKGMYDYTMLEINFVDERILSNNFEELEKSMFSDLGERKKNYYRDMVEYPTDISRKIFVKEVSKGYKLTNEEDRLINLHKFKMKERNSLYGNGHFRTFYSNVKTYILSVYDKDKKGGILIKKYGTPTKAKEIIYWNKNTSVFEKGGKNE